MPMTFQPLSYVLACTGVPTILLSSATAITATGAITGLTALPFTPAGVVRVYCFAQAGLAAGLYYATFSSATACQLYTDAAGTVTPSGITAGAYAGGTSQVTVATVVVPGGALGPNGGLRGGFNASWPNSAGTKSVLTKYGSRNLNFASGTTTLSMESIKLTMHNRGSAASQFAQGSGNSYAVTGSPMTYTTVDSAVDQNWTVLLQLTNAADYIVLEGYTLEVLRAAA